MHKEDFSSTMDFLGSQKMSELSSKTYAAEKWSYERERELSFRGIKITFAEQWLI